VNELVKIISKINCPREDAMEMKPSPIGESDCAAGGKPALAALAPGVVKHSATTLEEGFPWHRIRRMAKK
jgi:hypothetical protein